jgi:flagellar basal body-associated protein FliL
MKSRNKKIVWVIIVIIVVTVAAFAIDQFFVLQKAHSTFDNYYAFRGCTQLLSKTDTSGVCKASSGDTITIVLINGKWYLQGDGPGMW